MEHRLILVKFFKIGNLYYLKFVASFFIGGCSTPSVQSTKKLPSKEANIPVTEEEREWMEKFFKEFFLKGASLYTLFGTKPISEEMLVCATEEDYRKGALLYIEKEGIEGVEKEEILSEASKTYHEYDFDTKWAQWITYFERHPNSPFIFAKHPARSEKVWSAHILNIQETVWTLQKHYDIFRKEVGYDFDPVSVTMDFKNEDSIFWKDVFANHLLTGIVYGFGYKNSYFFDMYINLPNNSKLKDSLFYSKTQGLTECSFVYTLDSLSLPGFRSFILPFNDDPVLEKYKSEREIIKSKLNNSNFFEMVFLQLTGQFSKENNNQD